MDGGLAVQAARAASMLGTVAGAAVMVVVAWQFFKVAVSGSDRLLLQALRTLLVIAIGLAVLARPGEVVVLAGGVGRMLVDAVLEAARAALAGA